MIEITDRNKLIHILNLCKTRNEWINALIVNQNDRIACLKIINKKIYALGSVWCFSWRVITILLLVSFAIYQQYNLKNNTDINSHITSMLLLSVTITAIIGMVIWTTYKIIASIIHKSKVKTSKAKLNTIESNINECITQIDFYSKQISDFEYLPEVYWYAGVIIINYILNRRADTLKEAINLFEMERRSNIQFNQQMYALQQINEEIRKNRRSNAIGMTVLTSATIFSGFSKSSK